MEKEEEEEEEMGGACGTYVGEERDVCMVLVWRTDDNTYKTWRRLKDNIKVDIKKQDDRAWTGLNWLSTGKMAGYFE